ncbi:hypothetical protein IMSAGC006_02276 [Muribaculaceae bacterium]|nr:hypothetical protein IMSAGC006_02276 [Muribaculaceae bacterium]
MLCQALFFFIDIKFFDVVDQFLFKASAVIFHLSYLAERVFKTATYFCHTFMFPFRHEFEHVGYGLNSGGEKDFQFFAFLAPEVHQMVRCRFHCAYCCCGIFLSQFRL